jgi:branched-chain amino acid transport system substrate-binding protein
MGKTRYGMTAARFECDSGEASMHILPIVFLLVLASLTNAAAQKNYGPGVSDTEIRLGQTIPYSGPASSVGTLGRAELAYFQMLNEQGGVNGRKIKLISLDDGYSPPKTVEQTRKLVEQEQVLAIVNSVGTPTAATVQRYLNERRVPHLFVQSGAARFADPRQYPWTIPISAGYRDEARLYAKYILETKPDSKIGVLFQNDDFGKDYLAGFKQTLGSRSATMIVHEASYESSDPTIDSQIVSLQASGADVLLNVSVQKFASQAIRKADSLGWKPLHFLNSPNSSIPSVLKPAGPEAAVGLISARATKTPGDPQWDNDPEYKAYLSFMKRYYPAGDPYDTYNFTGYSWGYAVAYVLARCGDDLTRDNLMYQATHLNGLRIPNLLPGVTLNTTPSDYRPVKQFTLHRFDGAQWVPFGEVMEISSVD